MDERQARTVRERLVVALDLDTRPEALELVETLGDRVRRYKIGARMFARFGTELVDEVAARGGDVFVDLKFHDIPSTVEGAVEALADRPEVFMLTIHAAGGREMVRRAAEASGAEGPSVVAVTALTSLDAGDVERVAGGASFDDWVEDLADLAIGAGADGLVCSAREIAQFREVFGPEPLLVTPGIRPSPERDDDQKRAATPAEAIEAGSDYLVVGRPVYQAADPRAAVAAIGASL